MTNNNTNKEIELNGWERLWEFSKRIASIAVGIWCFLAVMPTAAPTADSVPSAGQIVIGGIIAAAIAGCATYGFLHGLEWVYRGFRPKKA